MSDIVVDLFAGPGGWDEGARQAGFDERIVGVEWDEAACATARAAGHERIHADVSALDPTDFLAGETIVGLIASPPCQAWSRSGKRGGIKDQPRIFAHVAECIRVGRWVDYSRDGWRDDRSPLVLEVLRWAWTLRPQWIACEQVEDVLPFWQEVARWLRGQGYSAWCGVLNAEEYGVPQTRRRAILLASRSGLVVSPPAASHERFGLPAGGGTDLFGSTRLPWVSMRDALGWGLAARPAWTVTAGGSDAGGIEVFGNAKCRELLRREVATQGSRPHVRLTAAEAGVLQGFRADYPWSGTLKEQHRQAGDAIPPPLAAAVLSSCASRAHTLGLGAPAKLADAKGVNGDAEVKRRGAQREYACTSGSA